MEILERHIIRYAIKKLDEYLESYAFAFKLQYGSDIELIIERTNDRYFNYWKISTKLGEQHSETMAKIETNMRWKIFSITINTAWIPIDYENDKELHQLLFDINRTKSPYPTIEISTDDPYNIIKVLILCEKYMHQLKSA